MGRIGCVCVWGGVLSLLSPPSHKVPTPLGYVSEDGVLLPPCDIKGQHLLHPPTTALQPALMPQALKPPMLHSKRLPPALGPRGWPGLPMAIQSRYRSQAAALSRAIRMPLMVMLRSGRKGRQGTCRDQAQGNGAMPLPRGTG